MKLKNLGNLFPNLHSGGDLDDYIKGRPVGLRGLGAHALQESETRVEPARVITEEGLGALGQNAILPALRPSVTPPELPHA